MQIVEGGANRTSRDNIAHIGRFHAVRTDRNELGESVEIRSPPAVRATPDTGQRDCAGRERHHRSSRSGR
jgi:hypothetical protein